MPNYYKIVTKNNILNPFTKLLLSYIIYIYNTKLLFFNNLTCTKIFTNFLCIHKPNWQSNRYKRRGSTGCPNPNPAEVSEAHIAGKPKVTEVQVLGLWKSPK